MAENSISYFAEEIHMSREKATMLAIGIAMVFGTLCALSFGPMADFKIFGKTIFDLFDYTTANLMMPICGIFFSIFAGWIMDKTVVRNQLTNGGSFRLPVLRALTVCLRYVAPAAILAVFVFNLIF